MAPAPPPPPGTLLQAHVASASGGFDQSGSRTAVEFLAIGGIVLGLCAALYFFAGALASWLTPLVPLDVDKKLGEVASAQIGIGASECTGPELAYVREIAAPLIEVADAPFQFQFRVVDDESINAFALPGGYVTVNRGLLEAADSGEEVAGVLGHELQHAIQRHGTRRMLRQMGGSLVLALLVGGGDVGQLVSYGAGLASLSYDRGEETEADLYGVALLVKAGIDPNGLVRFFQKLDQGGPSVPAILSTHPDSGERARLVKEAAKGQVFRKLPPPPEKICAASK